MFFIWFFFLLLTLFFGRIIFFCVFVFSFHQISFQIGRKNMQKKKSTHEKFCQCAVRHWPPIISFPPTPTKLIMIQLAFFRFVNKNFGVHHSFYFSWVCKCNIVSTLLRWFSSVLLIKNYEFFFHCNRNGSLFFLCIRFIREWENVNKNRRIIAKFNSGN